MAVDLTQPVPAAADWFVGMVDQAMMQAYLSDYLEALRTRGLDGGWQTLSVVAANFTAGANAPQYRRVGAVVMLHGVVSRSLIIASGSAFNGTAIFSALPTDCRPASPYVIHRVWCGVAGCAPELQIISDGTIQIRNMGTVDIPAGQGVGLDCMWFAG